MQYKCKWWILTINNGMSLLAILKWVSLFLRQEYRFLLKCGVLSL